VFTQTSRSLRRSLWLATALLLVPACSGTVVRTPEDASAGDAVATMDIASDSAVASDTAPPLDLGTALDDVPPAVDAEAVDSEPADALVEDSGPSPDLDEPLDVPDVGQDVPLDVDADTGGVELEESLGPALFAEWVSLGETEAILDAVAAWDGPVCDESGCLFVTEAPEGTATTTVLGEFNGWSEAAALVLSPVPGAPQVFWGVLDTPVAAPAAYKLQHDGEWALDPSNPYVLFGGFGMDSALTPPGYGRITVMGDVASPQLGNTRDCFVYLPAPYFEESTDEYPVLLMHDGFNVFTNPLAPFGTWDVEVTADALIAAGEVEPVIIVGVDTDDRLQEYTWTPIDLGDGPLLAKAPAYVDFLADTLLPALSARFRTREGPASTGIAGSSLGGIISMWGAWARPDAFGRVGSFSGAYWVGEPDSGEPSGPPMHVLIDQNPKAVPPGGLRVYLDTGDTSSSGQKAYSSDSWVYTDWTRNALIRLGWDDHAGWDTDGTLATPPSDLPSNTAPASVPHLMWSSEPADASWTDPGRDLLCVVGHGHQHNEAAWRQRFGVALRFLFPPEP
jgi:hypothetical protein